MWGCIATFGCIELDFIWHSNCMEFENHAITVKQMLWIWGGWNLDPISNTLFVRKPNSGLLTMIYVIFDVEISKTDKEEKRK